MMITTHLRVYDATLRFETNSKTFYAELFKGYREYISDRFNKVDWKIRVLEEEKIDFEVPEFAVRDSVVFPSAAMYIHKERIYLLEEGNYFVLIDQDKREVTATVKPSHTFFGKLRLIIKRVLVKLLEDKGFISMHGSAVSDNGNALLLTGVSGSGKTTSLLALLEKGYRMITDDVILINREFVFPFYLRSMIHRDTLKSFPSLASRKPRNSTWVPEADGWWMNLGEVYSVQRKPTTPKVIFHTYVWNSTKSSCKEIEPSKMLSYIIRDYMTEAGVIFPVTSDRLKKVFSVYSRVLERKPCYALYVGKNIEGLVKTIEDAVK